MTKPRPEKVHYHHQTEESTTQDPDVSDILGDHADGGGHEII